MCEVDTERMGQHIVELVTQRGKMHNPVTGSGGVLLGTVEQIDADFGREHHLTIGDAIVSLTSLSWLPLSLQRIHKIHLERAEVEVEGKAIFFRTNPLAKLPGDLPQALVVAPLDLDGSHAPVSALAPHTQNVNVTL